VKTKPQWIHEPDDGRGHRKVFVDGQEVGRAIYADERRGFVRFIPDVRTPFTHEVMRGRVEVRFP
jgi:hypothetical protein